MLKCKKVLAVFLTIALVASLFMAIPTVANAATNIALGKTATASSNHNTTNTAAKAFDGNTGTRWESDYSDPQWICVDLGAKYNITGAKIVWQNAAGKNYKIQVSADNSTWNDAYTVTNGTAGATLDVTFPAVNGQYVRMYGTARTGQYGYSIYEFEVYSGAAAKAATPVITPATGTYTTAQTVSISCGTSGAAIRYTTDGTTPTATTGTVYTGSFSVSSTATVKAIAYKSGMTDSDVAASVITISGGSGTPDFGPNVKIFDKSMSSSSIQSTIDGIYSQMESNQFGTQRYAMFFKPGSYSVNVPVGFYTSVYGLGQIPDDVTITGSVRAEADWMSGNATCNFWRSVENLADVPTYSASPIAPSGTETWAVSQAAPMRRVHIKGKLTLWDPNPTDYDHSWSSGGFIADTLIDGQLSSGSQQQYLTRNTKMASWSGSNWNMVFVGDQGAPAEAWPSPAYTVVNSAPVIREKPFLYIDSSDKYNVFVPAVRSNSSGVSWASGMGAGTSLPISSFYIAKPYDTASTLNQQLANGYSLIFTPGIYHLNAALNVTRADTVLLGLGMATLTPDNGTACVKVADVDGVKIAGLLFEAGAVNSSVLLEVGPSGSSANHSSNPTTLSDLFFRVGGTQAGKADVCLTINSSNVIGDDFWVWRADHGTGAGWTSNTSKNGMIVNGKNVTIYGLFVEHFQQYQTVWNGEGGQVYFYQSEMPYDVPNQASWMSNNGANNGYASYKVGNSVTTHNLYGSGVYSFNRDAVVWADRGIEVPNTSGVKVYHACSVFLSGNGGIYHVVNDMGAAAQSGATRQTIVQYP